MLQQLKETKCRPKVQSHSLTDKTSVSSFEQIVFEHQDRPCGLQRCVFPRAMADLMQIVLCMALCVAVGAEYAGLLGTVFFNPSTGDFTVRAP